MGGWGGKSGLEATLTTHSWVAMCRETNSLRGQLSPLQEMDGIIHCCCNNSMQARERVHGMWEWV